MSYESKVLIFGLPPDTSVADLQGLLGSLGARMQLMDTPRAGDSASAVVYLEFDRAFAWRLAERLNNQRYHGHRLQAWVPTMSWA